MRKLLLLAIKVSFVVTLLLSASMWSETQAQTDSSDPFRKWNVNALTPLKDYEFNINRSVLEYKTTLGPEFSDRVSKLKQKDIVVDAGAGLGVALLSMVKKYSVHGYAINAQDMLVPLRTLADEIRRDPAGTVQVAQTDKCDFVIWRVGPYQRRWVDDYFPLVPLYEALEIEVPKVFGCKSRGEKVTAEEVATAIEKLWAAMQQIAWFHYIPAFVEDALRSPTFYNSEDDNMGRVVLIMDVMGAFAYSAERARLLELYFNALAVGGEAFISLGIPNQVLANPKLARLFLRQLSTVTNHDVDLLSYLVNCFPDVFSVTTHNTNFLDPKAGTGATQMVIKITKRTHTPALHLGLTPESSEEPSHVEVGMPPITPIQKLPALHYTAAECPGIKEAAAPLKEIYSAQ